MENRWKLTLAVILAISLSACSGHKKADDEEAGSDETVAQDAGTDAVPKEQLESLPDPDKTEKNGDLALDSLPTDDKADPAPSTVADAPPSPDASPVTSSGETTDYTVQSGDTLMKIAFENSGDIYGWRKVYELNRDKIPDVNHLTKGVVLKVEKASDVSIDRNGEKYLIKVGDTLGRISDDVYGTPSKWRKIYENNRQMIKDPNRIYAGFYLYYQMSDQDQKDKEQFLQKKGPAPVAGGREAPAPDTVQSAPASQPADSGLIDSGPATGQARAPAATPAKTKK